MLARKYSRAAARFILRTNKLFARRYAGLQARARVEGEGEKGTRATNNDWALRVLFAH